MLTIRQEQLNALQQGRVLFYTWLAGHLRQHFPGETGDMPDADLDRLILNGACRASYFGLQSPSDIATFIDMTVALGSDFESQPEHRWIAAMLRDDSVGTPSARLANAVRIVAARPAAAQSGPR